MTPEEELALTKAECAKLRETMDRMQETILAREVAMVKAVVFNDKTAKAWIQAWATANPLNSEGGFAIMDGIRRGEL